MGSLRTVVMHFFSLEQLQLRIDKMGRGKVGKTGAQKLYKLPDIVQQS